MGGDRKRLAVTISPCHPIRTKVVILRAGSLYPHHRSSSSAKAGDPYDIRARKGGARMLDLRLRGDDRGVVAWMGAMYQHHNVTLPPRNLNVG